MTKNQAYADKAIAWAVGVEDSEIDNPSGGVVSNNYRYGRRSIALVYDCATTRCRATSGPR